MSELPASDLVMALESLARAQREAAAQIARGLDWPRAGIGVVRLLRRRGPIQLCAVAEVLRVDTSVASRHVGALVDAGYVRRTIDEHDRRARTLELTERGHALATESDRHFDAFVAQAFSDWTPDELTDAITRLRNVAAAISPVPEEADQR